MMPEVQDIPGKMPAEHSIPRYEFPILRRDDNSFMLPTYSEIVYTSREVDLDLLDQLQTDLETLLSATVARSQYFEQILHPEGEKRMETTGKRSLKQRHLAGAAKAIRFSKLRESLHSQRLQPVSNIQKLAKNISASPPITNFPEPTLLSISQPKHSFSKSKKTAHKYWLSIERFCRPISQYDIKFLNCMTEALKDDISRPFEVPPLGEHYTRRWAIHDLTVQERASDPTSKNVTRPIMGSPSASVLNLLKKGEDILKANRSLHSYKDASSLQSVLTESINKVLAGVTNEQYVSEVTQDPTEGNFPSNTSQADLLQALLAEEKALKKKNVQTFSSSSGSKHCSNISPCETNCVTLEDRLKRELADVGAIQLNEDELEEKDEIVAEMKRFQNQHKHLLSNNLILLERCTKLAEHEMRRQEIRKKLRSCDTSIFEIHEKINQCKLKKQPCSEQDRCTGWKLLKDREQLLKEIDSLGDIVV